LIIFSEPTTITISGFQTAALNNFVVPIHIQILYVTKITCNHMILIENNNRDRPAQRRTQYHPCFRRAAEWTSDTRRCRGLDLRPSAAALHRRAAARGWPDRRPCRTDPAAARSSSAGRKAGPLAGNREMKSQFTFHSAKRFMNCSAIYYLKDV